MTGRLYGVGVGPGDPELMTVKAARLIERAAVVAYPSAPGRPSIARRIAAHLIRPDHVEVPMVYPVTTGPVPEGADYDELMRAFYDRSAEALATHLEAGRDVAVLCEGDPLFYGSYMYLHLRLAPRFPAEVVPGVASPMAAAAALGAPMTFRDESFVVLPATLSEDELVKRLSGADAAALMKLGRHFDKARRAIARAGLLDRALYVERASMPDQRIVPLADADGRRAPYFALILVPGRSHGT